MTKPLISAARMSDAIKGRDNFASSAGGPPGIQKAGVYLFKLKEVKSGKTKKDGLDMLILTWEHASGEFRDMLEHLVLEHPGGKDYDWTEYHVQRMLERSKSLGIPDTSMGQMNTIEDVVKTFAKKVSVTVQLGVSVKAKLHEKNGTIKQVWNAEVQRSWAKSEPSNFDEVYWTTMLSEADAARLNGNQPAAIAPDHAAGKLDDLDLGGEEQEPAKKEAAPAASKNEPAAESSIPDLTDLSDMDLTL